jgi:hypothetical protein
MALDFPQNTYVPQAPPGYTDKSHNKASRYR